MKSKKTKEVTVTYMDIWGLWKEIQFMKHELGIQRQLINVLKQWILEHEEE